MQKESRREIDFDSSVDTIRMAKHKPNRHHCTKAESAVWNVLKSCSNTFILVCFSVFVMAWHGLAWLGMAIHSFSQLNHLLYFELEWSSSSSLEMKWRSHTESPAVWLTARYDSLFSVLLINHTVKHFSSFSSLLWKYYILSLIATRVENFINYPNEIIWNEFFETIFQVANSKVQHEHCLDYTFWSK